MLIINPTFQMYSEMDGLKKFWKQTDLDLPIESRKNVSVTLGPWHHLDWCSLIWKCIWDGRIGNPPLTLSHDERFNPNICQV